MRKIFFVLIIMLACINSSFAQNESMYILKNGQVVGNYNLSTEIDSITFNPPTVYSFDDFLSNTDYSIFHELYKRSVYYSFKDSVDFTFFAPDNTAFEDYFKANGISGVEAMSDTEIYNLFGLHILLNSLSRHNLIYTIGFGDQESADSEYKSLFFKRPMTSLEEPYKEFPRYHTALSDSIFIYTANKYIPLWSKDYFEDIFIPTDGSDFEFLYPNSDFDSESKLSHLAMNWGNAKVLPSLYNPNQLGFKIPSGYVYPIDQVVEPLPTLELYLNHHQDKYGLFFDLMQRFASYGSRRYVDVELNGEITSQEQYKKSYTNSLPNITLERGPRNDFGGIYAKMFYFTAFVPQDEVLQNYLDTYILPVFGDIDSVPELTLAYLLRSHLNNNLLLLSQMEDGYFDNFGTPQVLTRDEINSATMCSNGGFYDVKKVMEPSAFTSITQELFFNKDYSAFLFMLEENNQIAGLSTVGDEATFFATTNDELYAAGIRYNADYEAMEFYGVNNKWNTMKSADMTELVDNHITNEKITDFSGEGFIKMNSGNYVYYNNGVLQGPENQFLGESCTADVVKETEDGVMYHIDKPIKSRYYSIAKLLHNDTDEDYVTTLTDTALTLFSEMLVDNRLLNIRSKDATTKEYTPSISFMTSSENWTVFAPTNAAIREAQAAGLMPTSRDSLQQWIYYHFVPNRVIFDDGDADGVGNFSTYLEGESIGEVTTYDKVQITNAKNNLQVTDKMGQTITVEHSNANMLAQKGVVHKVNSILRAW